MGIATMQRDGMELNRKRYADNADIKLRYENETRYYCRMHLLCYWHADHSVFILLVVCDVDLFCSEFLKSPCVHGTC